VEGTDGVETVGHGIVKVAEYLLSLRHGLPLGKFVFHGSRRGLLSVRRSTA
jgi:hypothetical protein